MRKFIKKIKNSIFGKVIKFLFNIVKWAVELLIIGIAAVIITQRVTNNEKAFLGFRIFDVATGSMEPEYAVGDILIVREKEPSTIEVGNNIVYLGSVGDYKGKIITHSVIKIEQNEKGEYLFHTKGIANTIEDPIVNQKQLYGVVVQNNIVLAWLCKILTNRYGLYFFVIIPIILHAFREFIRIQTEKAEQEREEKQKKKEKQKNKKGKTNNEEAKIKEEEPKVENDKEVKEKTTNKKQETEKKGKTTNTKQKSKKSEEPDKKSKTENKTDEKSDENEQIKEVKKTERKKKAKTESEEDKKV